MKKKIVSLIFCIVLSLHCVGYCDNIHGDVDKTNIRLEQNYLNPAELVAERVGTSVVMIKSTGSIFFIKYGCLGSGVIFREDGYILTNNHVVDCALTSKTNKIARRCKIEVILPSKEDNKENNTYEAKVIARDPEKDLAVLKIEKTGLNPVEFADSDKLKVGEIAVAIGSPHFEMLAGTVTQGIISGLNRKISINKIPLELIQTDAAINPGNSGGALLNSKGELIGINVASIYFSEGLNFAIPSNIAKEFIDALKIDNPAA